jgi:hypothetical protein
MCSELCNAHYVINDNLVRLTYQTGCLFPEKFEPAYIHLAEVNSDENVRYLDEPIPLPRHVRLCIDHPLRTPQLYDHEFEQDESIRLSTLVGLFNAHYQRIYKEEEERSTHREFWVTRPCPDCDDDTYTEGNIGRFLLPCDEHADCFCYNDEEEDKAPGESVQLRGCNHRFHKECILRWFNTPRLEQDDDASERKSNSCPNCRKAIITCDTCQSTRTIKERYFGAVPPYNDDDEEQEDRPETDGPYGIHTIYYEELFFKGIVYDATQQLVRLVPLERIE